MLLVIIILFSLFIQNSAYAKSSERIVYNPIKIEFEKNRDELKEKRITYEGVYIMNLDGSNKKKLASSCLSFSDKKSCYDRGIFDVKFSPDGERVSFVKEKSLYVVTPDGSSKKKISDPYIYNYSEYSKQKIYSWSPDSKKIAYIEGGLFVYNLENNGLFKICGFDRDLTRYSWSSDGNMIAYIGNKNGIISIKDTQNGKLLKSFDLEISNYDKEVYYIENIQFSPDNSTLAVSIFDNRQEFTLHMIIVDIELETITRISELTGGISDYEGKISWSPMEKSLVFMNPDSYNCMMYNNDNQTIKELEQVTFRHTFSPDGQKILFNDSNKLGIYNVPEDTVSYINLSTHFSKGIGLYTYLSPFLGFKWSSDSQKICFADWFEASQRLCNNERKAGTPRADSVYTCKYNGSNFYKIPLNCQVTSYDLNW
jgi:Tol biopolymer transport system component